MPSRTAQVIELGIEVRRAYERKDWAAAAERRLDLTELTIPHDPRNGEATAAFAEREYEHLGGDVFTDVHALHELTEAALLALRSRMRGERLDDATKWVLEANANADEGGELSATRALMAQQVLEALDRLLPAAKATVVQLRPEVL
jgi:hypothetical protein